MPKTPLGRSWPLIEKISPKAAAVLQEADELEGMTIDFSDIFETNSPKVIKESFQSNGNKTISHFRSDCRI